MGEKLLTWLYTAFCIYFLVAFIVTKNFEALIISMWCGAMLEIRSRHNITIQIFTKEGEKKNDATGNRE